MTEKELIEKCKAGNRSAYRKLYETYSPYMMSLCFRYVGNEMLAEDVLHDGFLKVFQSLDSFQYRGEGSLKAWLCRIFYNESLLFLKKDKKWKAFLSVEENDMSEEEPEISSWQSLSTDVLMDFVARLSPGYRVVFNMYVFENLSHKEIALQLDIREDASRARLSRAKNRLTKEINAYLLSNE